MKTIIILLLTAVSMAALAQDTTIVQLEYFFDADQGIGKSTLVNVAPEADGIFPFTANISGLEVGYHKLYIRTKDSNGKWSFTTRNNVEVFAPDTKTSVANGEYFIDADSGFGLANPIIVSSPDSAILQNFSAATADLPVGYHKLYGRFKDNLGKWSLTFRRNIEVYKNDTNYVKNAEYFFKTDNGYGNGTTVKFANPSVDGTFSFNIPLSAIPASADTLFIRVQDSTEGKWSITAIKNISMVLPLTLLNFNVVKQNNTVQLNWQTANEINTSYFNVQRSNDGRSFASIGKVAAKGSNKVQNDYAYVDNNISQLHAGRLYYRLQEVDNDGKLNSSGVKIIDINTNSVLFTISPNPAKDFINISSSGNVANAQVSVTDMNGRILYASKQNFSANQQIKIPASRFAKQVLIVTINTSIGKQEFKVVKE